MKGTGLDKKSYDQKRAEDEQLLSYYRNHMDSDSISEEERAEYKKKADELIAKLEAKQKDDSAKKGTDGQD